MSKSGTIIIMLTCYYLLLYILQGHRKQILDDQTMAEVAVYLGVSGSGAYVLTHCAYSTHTRVHDCAIRSNKACTN